MRLPRQDCRVVARLVRTPILKGVRLRNVKKSVRVHKTGHRKAIDAPPGGAARAVRPHLAFVIPGRYDALITSLDAENGHYARGHAAGGDSRAGAPKKPAACPGQHARSGVCGPPFY